jgi:hypothetical protein
LLEGGGQELSAVSKLVDLHGSAAVAVLGDPRHVESWHVTGAVRLKNPKDAHAQFADATAKGKFKASESPAIRSKIYVSGKTSLALIGEALVFSDNPQTIESAGRWIGKETEGTPSHEVSLRVPLSQWSGQLKGEAKSYVDAEVQKDPDAASLEPLMRKVVDLVGDLGDVELSLDLEKQDAVVDFRLGASGGFASWLGRFPAGTPRSILTLPRGSVSVRRALARLGVRDGQGVVPGRREQEHAEEGARARARARPRHRPRGRPGLRREGQAG